MGKVWGDAIEKKRASKRPISRYFKAMLGVDSSDTAVKLFLQDKTITKERKTRPIASLHCHYLFVAVWWIMRTTPWICNTERPPPSLLTNSLILYNRQVTFLHNDSWKRQPMMSVSPLIFWVGLPRLLEFAGLFFLEDHGILVLATCHHLGPAWAAHQQADLIITVSIAFSNMPVLALQDWTGCFITTDFSTWAAALPTLTHHVNQHILFLDLWSSSDH